MTRKLIGKACKHAYLSVSGMRPRNDLLTAKITEYYDDGTELSKLIKLKNYKRDYYIVKEKYRTFKQKKDYIELNKVRKFSTNQSDLAHDITKILYGRGDRKAKLADVTNSPYVFGCQENVAVVFKQKFYDKWPECQATAMYSVAAYDVETYITDEGFGEINMASTTMNDKVYWCGLRKFFPDKDDATILRKLQEAADIYLDKDYMTRHNVNIEWVLADTPAQIVVGNVKAFHRYSPDYVVSWNANFDMKRNEEALLKEGYDPRMVYSDPSVPDEYKAYEYYEGREFKNDSPLEDQERFPVLRAPASWQWFDGMSFYAISRTAKGKKESYSLQYTAKNEGIPGKLYTEHGSHLSPGSADWHKYMQKNYPYVYAIYNIQDNFVIEDLNRETQDYSLSLPSLITSSELPSYQSQPTLISEKLSFIASKHGYVWGTTGTMNRDAFREMKPDLRNWIAILLTEYNEDNGMYLFDGLNIRSRGHHNVNDLDAESGYPSIGIALNISNKTTMLEVCGIDGFDRTDFRRFGVNYASSVPANATDLAKMLYGFPDITEIKDVYQNDVKKFLSEQKVSK